MKIIGFNFNKISVERLSDNFQKLKIENTIDLVDVKSSKSDVFSEKESLIEVKFNFIVNYEPKIAEVVLSGSVLILADPKDAKSFTTHWKDKKLPDEHKVFLFNVIMKKSNLKALELEDDLNLPLHVPLPSVKDVKKQ